MPIEFEFEIDLEKLYFHLAVAMWHIYQDSFNWNRGTVCKMLLTPIIHMIYNAEVEINEVMDDNVGFFRNMYNVFAHRKYSMFKAVAGSMAIISIVTKHGF